MKTMKRTMQIKSSNSQKRIGFRKPAGYALLLFMACSSYAEASVPDRSAALTAPLYAAAPGLSDAEITTALKTEFGVRPILSAESFNISTNEGIVQLTGTADNILAKDRAEKIALAVKGVRGVVNQIEVKASGRSDEEILKDVQKAMLMNPAADSYEVQAKVADGKVTLTGNADSWAEAQLATTVAKKVKGVRAVDNKIALAYKTNRLDTEIASDIEQKLRYDVRISDALIDVEVNRGAVALSGTVGSAFEKNQAFYESWVAGVKSVNTDALKVDPTADPDALRKDKFLNKTDAQVKDAVQDALLYDPRVNSFKVLATVNAGKVTLTGTVDNLSAKRAAEEDAKNVVGVWKVTNNIMTKPESVASAALEANVEWALIADPVVESYEINTTVNDGKVTLDGTVDTYFEKAFAGDIVADLAGVTAVDNNLKVKDTQSYLFWVEANPTVIPAPRESDEELKEDIQNQIWWSPFVDAEEVTVNVQNGKATLNGTVDSWNEENAAIENAFEGGAIAVVSKLKIDVD